MTKNILNFIVTIIIAYILSLFMDWYSVMIAAFLSSLLISLKRLAVFVIPFLAILLFWATYSFALSNANDFTMANRIAVLLPVGGSAYLLLLVTGIIGGIAAGISAVFGKQLSITLKKL